MADEKRIISTIKLRNDTSANWESAKDSAVLTQGEAGLEYTTDGKVKLKFGQTDENGNAKKWSELNYFESSKPANFYEAVLQTDELDEDAIERVTTGKELQQGDIAVVKSLIAGDSYSYTSYVYRKIVNAETGAESFVWAATDGNYSATNVYLKNNITLAGGFTSIGNYSKGKTINAGTSLESMLSGMLQQEIYPGDSGYAISYPSASISVSGSSGKVEVGNTFTLPTATLKITGVGSYPFEPKATGITFPASNVVLRQSGYADNYASNTSALSTNGTVTLQAEGTNTTYGDTDITFTFTGEASYSASPVTPKTNLGNEYASKKIAAGSCTVSNASATFKGYRKWFYGGDNKTGFDSTTIRALTNSSAAVSGQTFELKAASYSGCSRIVIAIPTAAGKSVTSVLLKSSSNADITGEFKKVNSDTTTYSIAGHNGYTPVTYNIWEYKPASLDSTEVYTITIG